ncbi:unnamed protein product, partial [Ceratitis capitata]
YQPQITTYHQTTPHYQTKPYHEMSQNYFNRQPISQNKYGRLQYRQYQQNFQPPRPNGPKPPKPIPIDIDLSQQTRAVNYINRSNFNGIAGKRSNQLATTIRTNFNESISILTRNSWQR